MVNKDNTLTVGHLLKSVLDGKVTKDMPVGVLTRDGNPVLGVEAFVLHTYSDGTQVLMVQCAPAHQPVASHGAPTTAEVFGD